MATWLNVTGSRTRVWDNVTTEKKHQQRYVTAGGSTPDRTPGVAGYVTGRRGRGRSLQYTSALSVTWTAGGPSTVGNMMNENVGTYSSSWWNVLREFAWMGSGWPPVEYENQHIIISIICTKNIKKYTYVCIMLQCQVSKYITIMARWLL